MNKKKTYENVIETLRDVKPTIGRPQELTDQIMNQLSKHHLYKKKGITISDYTGRWDIFIGFRTVSAIAAVFLVVFFAFQQWELMSKVSNLEAELYKTKLAPVSLKNPENSETEHFKQLLKQEFKVEEINLVQSVDYKKITDNKKLTELFIRAYFQLQDENQKLKKIIQEKYSNSNYKENVKQSNL